MSPFFSSVCWVSGYLALVLAPILLLLTRPAPPGSGFWWDFSIGLGLGAVALMVMMSLLTARFRRLTAPFGIDIIYYFHRQIALVLLFLVTAHVVTLFFVEPLLIYSYQLSSSYSMYTGTIALTSIVALVVSSIGRRQLGFPYEGWRRFHAVFAILAVGFTLAHMASINYYTGTLDQIVLWLVFAITWMFLLLYVRLVKPVKLLNRPYQLVDVSREGGDTWTLSLAALGHSGLRFMPGQFAWISANHSPLALAEHPFSFSSSAKHPEIIKFTIKELGDFTSTIKDLVPGQRVYVDGPFGTFTVDRYSASGYFFIAGGIGIAPIMSMLRTLADRLDKHPITLIYANRSPEITIFRQELEALATVLSLKIVYVFMEPPEGWEGESGLVDGALLAKHLPEHRKNWQYFTCGPAGMMKSVENCLYKSGIPLNRLHSEIFNLV